MRELENDAFFFSLLNAFDGFFFGVVIILFFFEMSHHVDCSIIHAYLRFNASSDQQKSTDPKQLEFAPLPFSISGTVPRPGAITQAANHRCVLLFS